MTLRLILDRLLGHAWISHPFGIEAEFGVEGVGRWLRCRRCSQLRREEVLLEPIVHRTIYIVPLDEVEQIEATYRKLSMRWKQP